MLTYPFWAYSGDHLVPVKWMTIIILCTHIHTQIPTSLCKKWHNQWYSYHTRSECILYRVFAQLIYLVSSCLLLYFASIQKERYLRTLWLILDNVAQRTFSCGINDTCFSTCYRSFLMLHSWVSISFCMRIVRSWSAPSVDASSATLVSLKIMLSYTLAVGLICAQSVEWILWR